MTAPAVLRPLRRFGSALRPAFAVLAVSLSCGLAAASVSTGSLGGPAADLLPAGTAYDPAVPAPEAALGFELGTRHAEPADVLRYAERLAASSPRVRLEIQGRTAEGRPQPLLIFASPERLARLEEVRAEHLKAALGEAAPGGPAVVWLGYSVHGNEASGANASLAVAWWLAAARGPEVEAVLASTVVLLDPSLNPDGLARFSAWVNAHAGAVPVGDRDHREHQEPWPGGRGNHYWFDLNRDWALAVHPETRARLATFHRWLPNLLGDFHEMGSDSTYFFQPGVPSRRNPRIPAANVELTRKVAAFHAAALDRRGQPYFSEEVFDDFYAGKGSTYPDLLGSVGVLFEQASARGRLMATDRGPLALRTAIANQAATSLAMLAAGRELGPELLAYQAAFFRDSLAEARRAPAAGWAFSTPGDPARGGRLADLLAVHGIEVRRADREVAAGGRELPAGETWVVPAAQPRHRLLSALFERRTEFADSAFYDVSAWTLPLAFAAETVELSREELSGTEGAAAEDKRGAGWEEEGGAAGAAVAAVAASGAGASSPVALLVDWGALRSPALVYRLLASGVRAAVAARPFASTTAAGARTFAAGTLVVHPPQTPEGRAALAAWRDEAEAAGVPVAAADSGLTPEGIDLGSPQVFPLRAPRPALVVGRGVSGPEAGEVWHQLDRRWGIPLALVERDRLARLDLTPYTHLLLVDGDWADLPEPFVAEARRWVRRGGVVVATRRAADWAATALGEPAEKGENAEKPEKPEKPGKPDGAESTESAPDDRPLPPPAKPYAEAEHDRQSEEVSGAAVEVEVDLTHPLAFGLRQEKLPVFLVGTRLLEPAASAYENPLRFTAAPLLAGYLPAAHPAKLAGTAAATAARVGEGAVVRFVFDPLFRGAWAGTERLYANALFFASALRAPEGGERTD